jgi:hypothetical protein
MNLSRHNHLEQLFEEGKITYNEVFELIALKEEKLRDLDKEIYHIKMRLNRTITKPYINIPKIAGIPEIPTKEFIHGL